MRLLGRRDLLAASAANLIRAPPSRRLRRAPGYLLRRLGACPAVVALSLFGEVVHEDGDCCQGGRLGFQYVWAEGDGNEALLQGLFHF